MADNIAKAEPEIRTDIKKAHKLPEPAGLPWSPTKVHGVRNGNQPPGEGT
jgi:hypothetical protein